MHTGSLDSYYLLIVHDQFCFETAFVLFLFPQNINHSPWVHGDGYLAAALMDVLLATRFTGPPMSTIVTSRMGSVPWMIFTKPVAGVGIH